jgi:type I restriction enzyme R subunit
MQTFSRTNRILNSIKTFGNIICFRNLEKNTNESIALFGDKDASGLVLLKSYNDYYNGYENNDKHVPGYKEMIKLLQSENIVSLSSLKDEREEQEFIKLYGKILRVKNILTSFDDFKGNEILNERDFQDYQSMYLELWEKYTKRKSNDAENINNDIVFEIELIKQVQIDIHYILHLLEKYHETNCKNKEILSQIDLAMSSSPNMRNKKELIEEFIKQMSLDVSIK